MADCVVLSSAARRRQRCVDSSLWDDRVILITDRGWAKRQNTTPKPPNPLRRRRRISSCKMTGTALSGFFFFFFLSRLSKKRLIKKIKWKPNRSLATLITATVGLRNSGSALFLINGVPEKEGLLSGCCFFFPFPATGRHFFLVLIRGWRDAARPGGESVGFLRDLKVTSTWLTVSV